MNAQTVFRFSKYITVSIFVASIVVYSLRVFSKLAIFIVTRPWRRYRTFTFRSNQWINRSYPLYCVVCLREAEEGDKMRRLTICRHCFHADCIDTWLGEMSSTCPLCRAEVPPSPPRLTDFIWYVNTNRTEVSCFHLEQITGNNRSKCFGFGKGNQTSSSSSNLSLTDKPFTDMVACCISNGVAFSFRWNLLSHFVFLPFPQVLLVIFPEGNFMFNFHTVKFTETAVIKILNPVNSQEGKKLEVSTWPENMAWENSSKSNTV
ncbi:hypothetical protein Bca52824_008188 [Brassica carinata]|uniref:RING-type E3 ubiquitin transferase n=1 Tax=Brassica carinata TaxID=52824 RepID=A0A8X7WAD3_BRACI|nr:hypothetical protein Bca52824_008188 [Brassica carinata]